MAPHHDRSARTTRRITAAVILLVASLIAIAGTGSTVAGATTTPGSAPAALTLPSVSAGASGTCGIHVDGSGACWGYDGYFQSGVPAGPWTAIVPISTTNCGIHADGTIECWGDNLMGARDAPTGTFTSLAGATYNFCAIRTDGGAACWGDNYYGESAPPTGTFTDIAAGERHGCGVQSDQTTVCWGRNDKGQSAVPAGAWIAVAAGADHTCGIHTDGTAACWGLNTSGQTNTPPGTWTSISAGGAQSCGIHTDGSLQCWGDQSSSAPTGGQWTDVTSGKGHSCAMRTTGTAECWGDNFYGQTGRITNRPLPSGTVGVPYLQSVESNLPGATFSITSGALPPGLTLSTGSAATGAIVSGTPTVAGTFGPFTITATDGIFPGGTRAFTITIVEPGSIAGIVTDAADGRVLPGITVTLMYGSWWIAATTTTDAAGAYRFQGLVTTDYRVRFFDPSGQHLRTWWGSMPTYCTSTPIVSAPATTVTADQALAPAGGSLAGRAVTGPTMATPVPGIWVKVIDPANGYVAGAITGPDGYYVLHGVAPGTYLVQFTDPNWAYSPQWYFLVPGRGDAQPVTIGATGTVWASAWLST